MFNKYKCTQLPIFSLSSTYFFVGLCVSNVLYGMERNFLGLVFSKGLNLILCLILNLKSNLDFTSNNLIRLT